MADIRFTAKCDNCAEAGEEYCIHELKDLRLVEGWCVCESCYREAGPGVYSEQYHDAGGNQLPFNSLPALPVVILPKALVERWRAEFLAAQEQFRFYAENHLMKGTADGNEKARTNHDWANRMRDAGVQVNTALTAAMEKNDGNN